MPRKVDQKGIENFFKGTLIKESFKMELSKSQIISRFFIIEPHYINLNRLIAPDSHVRIDVHSRSSYMNINELPYSILPSPLSQIVANLDITIKFITVKACHVVTSNRAITDALSFGTWPGRCLCNSHVVRAIQVTIHHLLAFIVRAREAFFIPDPDGIASVTALRRATCIDKFHCDASHACKQRCTFLYLRKKPVHLP